MDFRFSIICSIAIMHQGHTFRHGIAKGVFGATVVSTMTSFSRPQFYRWRNNLITYPVRYEITENRLIANCCISSFSYKTQPLTVYSLPTLGYILKNENNAINGYSFGWMSMLWNCSTITLILSSIAILSSRLFLLFVGMWVQTNHPFPNCLICIRQSIEVTTKGIPSMRISFKLATRSGPIALIAERNVSVAFFSCIFFLLIVTRNDRAGDFFF